MNRMTSNMEQEDPNADEMRQSGRAWAPTAWCSLAQIVPDELIQHSTAQHSTAPTWGQQADHEWPVGSITQLPSAPLWQHLHAGRHAVARQLVSHQHLLLQPNLRCELNPTYDTHKTAGRTHQQADEPRSTVEEEPKTVWKVMPNHVANAFWARHRNASKHITATL